MSRFKCSVAKLEFSLTSVALCPEQLEWRIINSDSWPPARSDWTILRADQFPCLSSRCWWWVTQLIITRESMPWILFSLPALWCGDTATLLHRHTHYPHPHTLWGGWATCCWSEQFNIDCIVWELSHLVCRGCRDDGWATYLVTAVLIMPRVCCVHHHFRAKSFRILMRGWCCRDKRFELHDLTVCVYD